MSEGAKFRLVGGARSVHDVGGSMRGGKSWKSLSTSWVFVEGWKIEREGGARQGGEVWDGSENKMRVVN